MEFKKINYEGAIVEVSKLGIIKLNGKIRNQYKNSDGYLCCALKTNKGWRSIGVHRLVAMAFIDNPENLKEVNHKDYNRINNNVENLEWISHRDNVIYSNCNRPDYNGSNNPNYMNDTLHLKYLDNPELALEKQSRKGLQNGRCQKINLYYDGVFEKTFDYIKLCCEYIQEKYANNVKDPESIRARINSCIRKNIPYKKHLTFEKI